MTKIIATFSDGTQDEYKGHRPVKAAWAIFIDGVFRNSGHSLDIVKAGKTARGNVRYLSGVPSVPDRPNNFAHSHAYWGKRAKENGFKSWREFYNVKAAERDTWVAKHVRIEIIEIENKKAVA